MKTMIKAIVSVMTLAASGMAVSSEMQPVNFAVPSSVANQDPTGVKKLRMNYDQFFVNSLGEGEKQELVQPVYFEGPYRYSLIRAFDGNNTVINLAGSKHVLSGISGGLTPMQAGKKLVALRDSEDTVVVCQAQVLRLKFSKCWQVVHSDQPLAVIPEENE
ncbi:hypothetical protein CHI95_23215 [Providencia rettgeri]|uniref:Uncharacterized protein n=1 Tax=Providencia rettgeri TaxID=587 RepID=A0A264VLL1_PRORE|nr:hypothetical protein [Providencia rettgeri]EKW7426973.1 hypothetical protein [Proteus mirabilis]ELR5252230.1 hypothetical protein [Providencia rettgeri]OZS72214.1 hypothetical protein CHI95_23215 [Providencia rettgeri]